MNTSQEMIVDVKGLTKRFGPITAVDDVTFTIRRQELFGILGPNGSGKTTTIRILCGLMAPTAGEVSVSGIDVLEDPDAVKRRIGYMSQAFGLYDDLSVGENLRFYAGVYGLSGTARAERVGEVVAQMRLSGREEHRTGTLSGGLKQRVALGCAILHRPELLFLDEPTAGVDPAARRLFWRIVRDLIAGGTTAIATTHYMDEAEGFDRLAFLSRGELIGLGPPVEVAEGFAPGASLEDVFVTLEEGQE